MKTLIKVLNQIYNAISIRNLRTATLLVVACAAISGTQSASGAGGLAGPDFLGIRVGMTPEETQSILKTRVPKETWQTVNMQLAFTNAKFQTAKVPNGTYRAAVENKTRDGFSDRYIVYLTPTPGKERVAAVIRLQTFRQDRPLFDELVAGLIEKYGKPTYRGKVTPGKFIWAFDGDGKPRAFGIKDPSGWGAPCENFEELPILSSQLTPSAGWSLRYKPVVDMAVGGKQINDSWESACGTTMVRAFVHPAGAGFAAGLTVELIGHAQATAGKESAVQLIESAAAADLARERGAAKKRSRPDL